jgi:DNA-binding NarL/FixJ family response regulator
LLGFSATTVAKKVKELGLPKRQPGKKKGYIHNPKREAQIYLLSQQGLSYEAIAERYGLTSNSVYKIIARIKKNRGKIFERQGR